jgi:glycosyltransferase involved in cell wall biosynthesis
MKILLICAFFPPEVGSAAHLYYELGKALQERGHEITVLTGLPRYHVIREPKHYRKRPFIAETYHGLRVFRVFNLDIPWNAPLLRGLDQFLSALCFGVAGCFLPPFDIALVYSPPLPLAVATYFMGRLRGKPVVLNVQDIFPQSAIDLGVLKNPWLIRCFKSMEAFAYRHFQLTIAHSEGNRRYIISRGGQPQKVMAIPNWVDTEAIKPDVKLNALRTALGLEGHFIVSFAGIMGYSQDLGTIIQVAALLKDHQNIAFVLVGDGVEKPGLQKMVQDNKLINVHFLPMQPKAEYPKVLAASDLCLVTLRKEVQTPVVPSKILSIMAAGRPILASLPLNGDAPRLIAEAQCGVCLPPENPERLSEAILKFSRDIRLGEEMGARGRHYAVKHLSLKACVIQLEKLFKTTFAPS